MADTATIVPLPFKSIAYVATEPGPRLVVLGAVHGDETCGTRAIERVVREIDAGELRLARGRLTLVPVTNPLAYAKGQRTGDRNLNRKLAPTDAPREYEDHVANWLCPLLAAHEVLLDLHSFRAPGVPFVFIGSGDNTGPLESFAHARREEALALRLGVGRAVDGWLATYAAGVARRRELAATMPDAKLDLDPRYGIGTTEYMRSVGGWAVTLECGRHDDAEAPEVAHRAIVATLAHLGLVEAPDPAPAERMEMLSLFEVVDKLDDADTFARPWRSFDAVPADTLIGTRRGGAEVRAPCDATLVFPNPSCAAGQEWFYLARRSERLAR